MMNLLSKGIAHVSFKGGGMCLPARNPYDRQMLAEQVTSRARAMGMVQVLLDDDRWMVHTRIGSGGAHCARCGRWSTSVCHSDSHDGTYCVVCAVGNSRNPLAPVPTSARATGS